MGMKKVLILVGVVTAGVVMVSCNKTRRSTGRAYMPDMSYSRAYETYAATDNLKEKGIFYDATPVAGTVAREDMPAFPYAKDKQGDTANYVASKTVVNPLPPLDAKDYLEAARLFLVNCGICHGPKLDGNGPLYNGGSGPFPSAPKNLVADPVVSKMPDGQMFYSVTYGKNVMGSYASQLSTKQRWMIIHYIKEKQAAGGKAVTQAADSTGKK